MFLHLGNDISVRAKDIISIHDYEIFKSGENNDVFKLMMSRGSVYNSKGLLENVKSVVITNDFWYLSAISPVTLKRRAAAIFTCKGEDYGIR